MSLPQRESLRLSASRWIGSAEFRRYMEPILVDWESEFEQIFRNYEELARTGRVELAFVWMANSELTSGRNRCGAALLIAGGDGSEESEARAREVCERMDNGNLGRGPAELGRQVQALLDDDQFQLFRIRQLPQAFTPQGPVFLFDAILTDDMIRSTDGSMLPLVPCLVCPGSPAPLLPLPRQLLSDHFPEPLENLPGKFPGAWYSPLLGVLSIMTSGCFGWVLGIPALILGILRLVKISREGTAIGGKGRAIAGIVLGTIALLIGILSLLPDDLSRKSARFLAARQVIAVKDGDQIGFGNTAEAIKMAKSYADSMRKLREEAFHRQGGNKPLFTFTGNEFLTWCQIEEGKCAFLVHVPELKNYDSNALDLLSGLAWSTARNVLAEARDKPSGVVDLAVELSSMRSEGVRMIGKSRQGVAPGSDGDPFEGVSNRNASMPDLLPFFPVQEK